jgi:hypothetical protein
MSKGVDVAIGRLAYISPRGAHFLVFEEVELHRVVSWLWCSTSLFEPSTHEISMLYLGVLVLGF